MENRFFTRSIDVSWFTFANISGQSEIRYFGHFRFSTVKIFPNQYISCTNIFVHNSELGQMRTSFENVLAYFDQILISQMVSLLWNVIQTVSSIHKFQDQNWR